MSDHHRQSFGPWPYDHSMADVFLDGQGGAINYEYFREYFDAVSLPMEVAKACLGDRYFQFAGRRPGGSVRFLRLSTLREHSRIPGYEDVRDQLVDHGDIPGFALSGPLPLWGGRNVFATTPCVFVSHRWRSPGEPDPDGAQLGRILERLNGVPGGAQARSDRDVYLWIDYSCLPQRGVRSRCRPKTTRACRPGSRSSPSWSRAAIS